MSASNWILAAIIVILVIVAFIFGAIALFTRLFPGPNTVVVVPTPSPVQTIQIPITTLTPTPTPTLTPTPTPTPLPIGTSINTIPQTATPVSVVIPVTTKVFSSADFTIFYPESWGLLTCINSPNFEFDPITNINQRIVCNFAQKPITVLVSNDFNGCGGNIIRLGPNEAIKSVIQSLDTTVIQWCTVSQPVLKISHRVSPNLSQATSNIDFSPEIESMISTIQFR